MAKDTRFTPPWTESPPPPGTCRALLKWGSPTEFKHPNRRLYEHMKHTFGMTVDDTKHRGPDARIRLC